MNRSHVVLSLFALISIIESLSTPKISSEAITPSTLQCPCVKRSNGQCWSYNSKYLAADIDEAIVSFPDLSMLDPPDPVDDDTPGYCRTDECKECQRLIRQRLCQIGAAKFNMTTVFGKKNSTCNRYSFKIDDDDIDWCDNNRNNTSNESHSDEIVNRRYRDRRSIDGHRVVPYIAAQTNILGKRHFVKCTRKGEEVDQNGYISLCSACWAWRELPPEYFPRYVNELVCMDSDSFCLSKYGTCYTGFHSQSVLKKINGVLQPVNINTAAYCECKTQKGSPVYNIVMG